MGFLVLFQPWNMPQKKKAEQPETKNQINHSVCYAETLSGTAFCNLMPKFQNLFIFRTADNTQSRTLILMRNLRLGLQRVSDRKILPHFEFWIEYRNMKYLKFQNRLSQGGFFRLTKSLAFLPGNRVSNRNDRKRAIGTKKGKSRLPDSPYFVCINRRSHGFCRLMYWFYSYDHPFIA